MSREILFRGKSLDGKWVKGFNSGDCEITIERASADRSLAAETVYEIDPPTLGQYTGLKDKNGIRIFEGDKVQISFWKKCRCRRMKENAVIEFYSSAWCSNIADDWIRNLVSDDVIEVIGNIHDKE